MAKWRKTKFPGVRVRESDSRRFQGKPDKYFTIRYTDNGKSVEEPVGWLSDGESPAHCSEVRGKIVQNIRLGQGPQSLKEQRELEDIQKQNELNEKAEADKENIPFRVLAGKQGIISCHALKPVEHPNIGVHGFRATGEWWAYDTQRDVRCDPARRLNFNYERGK